MAVLPVLRRLQLCCVRREPVCASILYPDVVKAQDLSNVNNLLKMDVLTSNLWLLSVRSFRFLCNHNKMEVVVLTPRKEAICCYDCYPKQLHFLGTWGKLPEKEIFYISSVLGDRPMGLLELARMDQMQSEEV